MPAWLILGIMGMAFTFVLATGQTAYWMWVARQERQQEELLRRISGQASDQVNPAGLFRENEQDAAGRALGSFGDRAQEVILAADSTLTVSALLTQMGVLAAVGSGVAAVVIIAGALWSAWRVWRGRNPSLGGQRIVTAAGRLVWGNLLIATGTLVLSGSGTLAGRLGKDRAFAVTLLVGIVVLFLGFLVASAPPRRKAAAPELRSVA